jgi:IS5 family transposase
VLRTVSDQPTLWDAILPSELLVLPAELARVDALLDDPVFFAPFAAYFYARIGRHDQTDPLPFIWTAAEG